MLLQVQKHGREHAEALTGTVQNVLFETPNEQDETLVTGRLDNSSVVHVKAGRELIGKILPVRLVECKGFYYMGELA